MTLYTRIWLVIGPGICTCLVHGSVIQTGALVCLTLDSEPKICMTGTISSVGHLKFNIWKKGAQPTAFNRGEAKISDGEDGLSMVEAIDSIIWSPNHEINMYKHYYLSLLMNAVSLLFGWFCLVFIYLCNLLSLGVVLFAIFRFGGQGIILLYPCISGFLSCTYCLFLYFNNSTLPEKKKCCLAFSSSYILNYWEQQATVCSSNLGENWHGDI